MAKAAGYVLNVADHRREELSDAVAHDETLAEAVPDFAHSRNVPLVCFASFEPGSVTHLASARRGARAGTGLRRLNLREVVALPAPLEHSAIVARVESRMRRRLAERLTRGGLLPPGSFDVLVEAVRELVPASRIMLDRYSSERRARTARLLEGTRASLAYQKEAVATALALAGLDRRVLQAWEPPADVPPTSFLDGLPVVRAREDAMVVADMMQVPGFDLVRALPHGAAVFEGDGVRLTVVLANHLPLEQQLGADLIYYNETYKAFVVVQYKAMERGNEGAVFRLPDAQLTTELARMDAALTALQACASNTDRHGFRLLENPFYLKLCPRLLFNPDDAGLVPGMYLPLQYWRLIEGDPAFVGPRGGRQVTYENVGRYLDNSAFVGLVGKAWIGTSIVQSAVLSEVIRAVVGSGRALTLAVKIDVDPPSVSGLVPVLDLPPQEMMEQHVTLTRE